MSTQRHRTIRLTDAEWQELARLFREVVPDDRRPAHARPEFNWQITEGLRMVAAHELAVEESNGAERETVS